MQGPTIPGRQYDGALNHIAFSPDGRILASAHYGGYIRFWDPLTAREVYRIQGHREPICSIAFSCDGNRLASGGKHGSVCVWDVPTRKQLVAKPPAPDTGFGPSRSMLCLALSPDGKLIATGDGGDKNCICVWEADSGKDRWMVKLQSCVACLAFSPDGRSLASASYDGPAAFGKWRRERSDGGLPVIAASSGPSLFRRTGEPWPQEAKTPPSCSGICWGSLWRRASGHQPFSGRTEALVVPVGRGRCRRSLYCHPSVPGNPRAFRSVPGKPLAPGAPGIFAQDRPIARRPRQ